MNNHNTCTSLPFTLHSARHLALTSLTSTTPLTSYNVLSCSFHASASPRGGWVGAVLILLSNPLHHLFGQLQWRGFALVLRRVVKHAGADAVAAARAFKHINVDAALAAAPESLVVGKVGKSNGHVTELGVHLHHRRTASVCAPA